RRRLQGPLRQSVGSAAAQNVGERLLSALQIHFATACSSVSGPKTVRRLPRRIAPVQCGGSALLCRGATQLRVAYPPLPRSETLGGRKEMTRWKTVKLIVVATAALCIPRIALAAADPAKVLRISSYDIASLDPQQGTDLYSTRVASTIF